MLIEYDNIGRIIDEINSFYGTVLKMKKRDNMYKLDVKWNNIIPPCITIYTQDGPTHWYIEEVPFI